MEALIKERLCEIEGRKNCRILLAVESGSRAWGFASPDSDYDVRFIYVRPKESYLRLYRPRDVIERPLGGHLEPYLWPTFGPLAGPLLAHVGTIQCPLFAPYWTTGFAKTHDNAVRFFGIYNACNFG